MTEYPLSNGGVAVFAPLTYLSKQKYFAMLRLALNSTSTIASKIGLSVGLDESAITNILADFVRVSAHLAPMESQVAFTITCFTADLDELSQSFAQFLDTLESPEIAQQFEDAVKALGEFEKEQSIKAPTPPIDPNLGSAVSSGKTP